MSDVSFMCIPGVQSINSARTRSANSRLNQFRVPGRLAAKWHRSVPDANTAVKENRSPGPYIVSDQNALAGRPEVMGPLPGLDEEPRASGRSCRL